MKYTPALIICLAFAACSADRAPPAPVSETRRGIQRIPCATNTDCRARGGECTQNVCTADNECAADADCALREVCVVDSNFGGLCAPPATTPIAGPAWSCAADADCPAAQVCTRGSCGIAPPTTVTPTVTPPMCASDGDCASGEICRADGVCVVHPWACTTDADCDPRGGYVCTHGQCGVATSHGCNGNNCPCDVFANTCAFGMRCYPFGPATSDGQCFVPGARGVGDPCVEPPFGEPESCGLGLVCVAESEEDPAGLCYQLCATDLDCGPSLICHPITDPESGLVADWGLCTAAPPPPPPPVCGALAQDCPAASDLCAPVDIGPNVCVAAGSGGDGSACTQASDCSEGLACVAASGASPTTTYWTLLQAYIDRGGGTCKTLCAPGPACAGGRTCDPISGSNTGISRSDVGVCH